MIAVSAFILMAQAAPPCAAPEASRLGGGALLVRPIGTNEPAPFIWLGPSTHVVTRSMEIEQTGATTGTPEADPPSQQCEADEIPII